MADPNAVELVSRDSLLRAVAGAAALLLLMQHGTAGAAALPAGTGEIQLSAGVMNSDPRKDVHELSGNVRISQGEMSLEADKATASAMETDHARWTFDSEVRIQTPDANLTSDTATATFANGQISAAVAKGTPATFEQRNATADKRVRGRANNIEYDFDKGTVKLTDNVWFSQGGNEFRGSTLIYYVRDQRVVMNPGGKESGRVNITIRPRSGSGTGAGKAKPADPADAAKAASESGA